jgi:adenosylmethionine-8-amino-7-oxononanoate aminotransferase/NADH:ubiquinone oxidoreductase subunit 3 (subunit A)
MRNLIQTYQEKYSIFECGFHSFLGQNRTQFGIKFFIFGLVFLLLDLEILLIFPFPLSGYVNGIYGLILALIFLFLLTLGFIFELGKSALKIESRQVITSLNDKSSYVIEQVANFMLEDKGINNIKHTLSFMGEDKGINNIKHTLSFMKEDNVNLNEKNPKNQKKKNKKPQKKFFSGLSRVQLMNNIDLILSYNISKLYLIKKDFFSKFLCKILYVLAILLVISLYIVREPNVTLDLYLFFNKSTFVASLFMIYLMYNHWNLMLNLCINSLCIIINMLILSLITSFFIYLIINLLLYDNFDLWYSINWTSYSDCFIYSRTILGFILSTKLIFHIFKNIFLNIENSKKKFNYIFLLIISLMTIAFFYKVFFYLFAAFNVYILYVYSCESEAEKYIFNNSSELGKFLKDSDDLKNYSNSLNHHFKKHYPTIVSAKGSFLYTEDGKEIFDAASGAAAACIGYGNEKVIAAMYDKFMEGTHYLATSYWKDRDVLKINEWLINGTGNKLTKVYLTGSGSDATEACIKLIRQFYYDQDNETERHIIITRENSYHGNTIGALSASSFIARQLPFYPILTDNVEHISACNYYRQQLDEESIEEFVTRKALELENKILEIGPKKIMCFLMEPVSGAALGCVPSVPGYLKAMQEVCHKYDILIVFDEVMCGMGRTGLLHAWQEEGVAPDVLIIGKGLGGGYHPISALLVAPKVWEALKTEQFIHGLTFDAVPVGAVAAWNVHQIIEDNNLLDNVSKQGVYLGETLKTKLADHPNVGDIRGKGLFWGIELVKDKVTKEPFDAKLRVSQLLVNLALSEYNMVIYQGTGGADGLNGDHIMIHPPYNITAKDVDHIVNVVTAVVEKVMKEINF